MKKVVLASLLAVACAGPLAQYGFSQTPAANQPAGGQVVDMSPEEGAAYNNARTQTTPAAQAAAWEGYLKAYPQSAVKAAALQALLIAYSSGQDNAKTLDAADRLLQVDPNNLYAFVFETTLRGQAAGAQTDATARQTGLDAAADDARKGLAATKPASTSDADWAALKAKGYPYFYSAIGAAAFNKKDAAGAISAFNSELAALPVAATIVPGPVLQDTYYLGQAYSLATPPDYLSCAYFTGRAMNYAPEPFKTNFKQFSTYCYHKYHGNNDTGFDGMIAIAKDNLTPPPVCPPPPPAGTPAPPAALCLAVTPAPKPEDMVANLIATTPDLAALAISDKEFVLQYGRPAAEGRPADADKLFDSIKGKSVTLPDVLVIAATDSQVTAAVSDDAVQNKTADFVFNFKEPLKTLPAVGDKVTLSGTYDSYTKDPLQIIMSDSALVPKKAPVKKTTPAHRPTHS
jgi:hypothetical protein